jgi:hypothetical protein
MQSRIIFRGIAGVFAVILMLLVAAHASGQASPAAGSAVVAVGPQYGTTHVYVAPGDFDALVNSFIATFGGTSTRRIVVNIAPVPSSSEQQAVLTPAGSLSIFAFHTPIPFPFGEERTGYLVTDMARAIEAARAAGAEIIVEPFNDPIGIDAVIQWPGGVKMQLYWHLRAPSNPPLQTVPENRVYVSPGEADNFVRGFVQFSGGKVIADDKNADAGEIGRRGEIYRRIRIASLFENVEILVTDGHLPYPFGRELTGYEVKDLNATLDKAKAAGARILSLPYVAADRTSAVVEFPGGYIAEIHSAIVHQSVSP